MTMNMKIVCGITVLALISGIAYAYVYPQNPVPQGPPRTDFGTSAPPDFPANIPVESDAKINQSYSLDYTGQKQLTIVFLSAKTVEENHSLYTDFLKNQNWDISNTYSTSSLSSLYGTKENYDINVTISKDSSNTTVESQISISVLKKL